MSEQVKLWVAGWDYNETLVLELCEFKRTAKLYRLTSEPSKGVKTALGYGQQFSHDDRRLHTCHESATTYLVQVQDGAIAAAEAKIKAAEGRLDIIKGQGVPE